MGTEQALYADEWGTITVDGYTAAITWNDTTESLDAAGFQAFLLRFVDAIEQHGSTCALVDVRQFKMNRDFMDQAWRDQHIIPRYNAAGLNKFAFVVPGGAPVLGNPPAPEGPAQFPTAYFGSTDDAEVWLAG